MEIKQKVIDATLEIFSTMVMMEITARSAEGVVGRPLQSSITGMIGLAGSRKGFLAFHIPNDVAMAITGSFLGMEVDEINEDVMDAVGELANMLGGNVKSILAETGGNYELSLPTTISGAEYNFQSLSEGEIMIIPFVTADNKEFLVELQLEKAE